MDAHGSHTHFPYDDEMDSCASTHPIASRCGAPVPEREISSGDTEPSTPRRDAVSGDGDSLRSTPLLEREEDFNLVLSDWDGIHFHSTPVSERDEFHSRDSTPSQENQLRDTRRYAVFGTMHLLNSPIPDTFEQIEISGQQTPNEPVPNRIPQEPMRYNPLSASSYERQFIHRPYSDQIEEIPPLGPPNTSSLYVYPLKFPPPAFRLPDPSDVDLSDMTPVRVYHYDPARPPAPPMPPSQSSHRRPINPSPNSDESPRSRFSIDDDDKENTCLACGEVTKGHAQKFCTCPLNPWLWARVQLKKFDKKGRLSKFHRHSTRDCTRAIMTQNRTDTHEKKVNSDSTVPPAPPNTPAQNEELESDISQLGSKRASKDKGPTHKAKRSKTLSTNLDVQGCEVEPGKWLDRWRKGVKSVLAVGTGKPSGSNDKEEES